MYVSRVRLQDYSHLEWWKLNIEQYISGSPFAAFRSKSSRFVKLVQYNSYLTTVVEAPSFTTALVSKVVIEPTTFTTRER